MKKVFIALMVILVAVGGLFFYIKFLYHEDFKIIFFNVGQGDSALILFGNGQRMLVDCGIDRKILNKLGEYLPFWDRRIDYLLVTHPDNDHYGGCVDVIKRYKIGQVIDNGATKPDDAYWGVWDEKIKNQILNIKNINGYELWHVASTTLEFLAPDESLDLAAKDKDSNNLSVVFKLTYANTTVMFMGDAELPLERALVQKYCLSSPSYQNGVEETGAPTSATPPKPPLGKGEGAANTFVFPFFKGEGTATPPLVPPLERGEGIDISICPALRADYLKVGHHGSDSSSGDEWLDAIAPKTAVISVGKNSFGHPSLRVLRRLERAGVEIWRTDLSGDLMIDE